MDLCAPRVPHWLFILTEENPCSHSLLKPIKKDTGEDYVCRFKYALFAISLRLWSQYTMYSLSHLRIAVKVKQE